MVDVRASQTGNVVQEGGASGNETIVMIALDGSEPSFFALDWYLKNLHKSSSELCVVHCSEYKDIKWTSMMATDVTAVSYMIQQCEEEINRTLANIKERLTDAKVNAKLLRLSGDVGHAIVKAAKEHKANYIVTGSRGLSKTKRTFIGSVSNYIVHHSHCPVLVCHYKNQ